MPPQFDDLYSQKYEWLGRGADGFPVLEGKVDDVQGKKIEIWCERGFPHLWMMVDYHLRNVVCYVLMCDS